MNSYIVIVPFTRNGRIKAVSYPASGCQRYTRTEAIALLKRFDERWGTQPMGAPLERYAEGAHERFALCDVEE